jgi:hypothetical protein
VATHHGGGWRSIEDDLEDVRAYVLVVDNVAGGAIPA